MTDQPGQLGRTQETPAEIAARLGTEIYAHTPRIGAAAVEASGEGGPAVLFRADVAKWTAKAERAGNPVLPQHAYDILVEVCNRWEGKPVEREEDFGAILCEVAHRSGLGVSRKTGGKRVPSPVGEIAEDVLQDCPSGHHWDVLGSAAVGRPLQPGRGPSIGVMTDGSRPCVPVGPVPAAFPNGGGHVDPGPVDPPPPPPPPPTGITDAMILAAIGRLEAGVEALRAQNQQIEAKLAEKMSSQDIHALIGGELIGKHIADILVRLDLTRQAAERAGGGGSGCVLRGRFGASGEPGDQVDTGADAARVLGIARRLTEHADAIRAIDEAVAALTRSPEEPVPHTTERLEEPGRDE